jgi:hypothetical protein
MDRATIRAGLMLGAVGWLMFTSTGCIATAVVLGAAAIGEQVRSQKTSVMADKLIGEPPDEADAALGPPIRTLVDTRGPRVLKVYPVEGDTEGLLRWVVEVEKDRIVAVTQVRKDPDAGRAAIEKAGLDDLLIGRSPAEIRAHERFEEPALILRDRSTGGLVYVYDVEADRDLGKARYCVLDFDADDRCTDIRLAK